MSLDLSDFPPITDAQRDAFEALTSGPYENLAVLSARLDDEPVAVIVAITLDGEMYDVTPLAILVEATLFPRLTPPIEPEPAPAGAVA